MTVFSNSWEEHVFTKTIFQEALQQITEAHIYPVYKTVTGSV